MPKTKLHKDSSGKNEPIEQTTDGSYKGNKTFAEKMQSKVHDEFLKEFDRAKAILKSQPVSLTIGGNNLYLQWTSYLNFDDTPCSEGIRHKKPLGALTGGKFPLSRESVQRALKIALEIAEKINCGKFSWLDYWQWIPEDKRPKGLNATTKPVSELIEEYKQHFFDTHGNEFKHEEHWRKKHDSLSKLPQNEPLSDDGIKKALIYYKIGTCTRKSTFFVLQAFCKHFDYKFCFEPYRDSATYEPQKKKDLTDKIIVNGYFAIKNYEPTINNKNNYKGELTAWVYGMMATYGLRNHEVFNIKNLTTDYVDETGFVFPAFNTNPSTMPILCTTGKTGERIQPLPMLPQWVDLFELRNIPVMPDWFDDESLSKRDRDERLYTKIENLSKTVRDTVKLPFTFYNLRHAYALRCRANNVNPIDAANFMGHSLEEHNKTYHSSISHASKIRNAENAIAKIEDQRSREQIAIEENEKLKAENAYLREQNERLQLELRLIREMK